MNMLTASLHGTRCPCCGQYVKLYKRSITATMAWTLLRMYRSSLLDWVHVPTLLRARGRLSGDHAKLAYWGLIQEATIPREDGGKAG